MNTRRTKCSLCEREIWYPHAQCIFHSGVSKSVEEFTDAFLEELERVNRSDTIKKFSCRSFIFPDNLQLENLFFSKDTSFDNASFGQNVSFSKTKFVGETSFRNTRFLGKISCNRTHFVGPSFWYGRFEDDAFFDNVYFENGSYFGNSRDNTYFGGRTSFRDARFARKIAFENIRFAQVTDFLRADFLGSARFNSVEFSQEASLHLTHFLEEASFLNITHKKTLYLSSMFFEKPARFHNIDFNNVLLKKSNLEEVEFLSCTWPIIQNRKAVFDEAEIYDKVKPNRNLEAETTLGLEAKFVEVGHIYKRLQMNFEKYKSYAEAGDFYVGTMEMRRKIIACKGNMLWRWLRQNLLSLEGWYRNISKYGQSYFRTLIWMSLIFTLFAIFYLLTGFRNEPNEQQMHPTIINYEISELFRKDIRTLSADYTEALVISMFVFTFQRNMPYKLSIESQIISVLEATLSASLLALFLLAIRRKFKR